MDTLPPDRAALATEQWRRERPDLEERRSRIEQPLDPVAREQFATRGMALATFRVPAKRGGRDVDLKPLNKRTIVRGIGVERVAVDADLRV